MANDWTEAWQATIDSIGRDFSGGVATPAIDVIELGAVRKFCEPLELDCPLHYDETVAVEHGYRGVVAPVSGLSFTWVDAGKWRPGLGTRYPIAHAHVDIAGDLVGAVPALPTGPCSAVFATDIGIDYHEPAVVGDRLTLRGRKLASCVPRETRVGRGAFIVWERQVVNQRDELVAQTRTGAYMYVPTDERRAGTAGEVVASSPAEASEEDLIAVRKVGPGPASPIDWSRQRYFEDVEAGDEIPSVTFNLTIARLVVEAGANRDFSQIHHNTPVSRATGAPEMYANNVFIQGWWERTVREYIGLAGRFKKTGPFRMRFFNRVGEAVVTRGVVRKKWIEEDDHVLEIEMRSETSEGVSVGPAAVVVSLPSRSS